MKTYMKYIIPALDLESNIPRKEFIRIIVQEPDVINESTKIMFDVLAGEIRDGFFESKNKIRKINNSDTFNLIIICVEYHGIYLTQFFNKAAGDVIIDNEFIEKIKNLYNIDISHNIENSFNKIKELGINKLPEYIHLSRDIIYEDYLNYGYLASLDHLEVAKYIFNKYGKRKCFFTGYSYGGYVAQLIYKINLYKKIIDPNLIEFVVDISGLINYDIDLVNQNISKKIIINGIEVVVLNYNQPLLVKDDNFYHKRTALLPENKEGYKTKFYMYHGTHDHLVNYKEKIIQADDYKNKGYDTIFNLITEDKLNNLYKNTEHCCGIDLRLLLFKILK